MRFHLKKTISFERTCSQANSRAPVLKATQLVIDANPHQSLSDLPNMAPWDCHYLWNQNQSRCKFLEI